MLSAKKSGVNKGIINSVNDKKLAIKLVSELKTLDSEKFEKTIKKAKAVLRILKKEGIMKVIADSEFNKKSLSEYVKRYRAEGLVGLSKTEKFSLHKTKRDTSNYEQLALKLTEELNTLDWKNFPRTKERADAILPVLKKKNTIREIAKEIGSDERSIQSWISTYEKKDGMKRLKDLEHRSIRQNRKGNPQKDNNINDNNNANVARLPSQHNQDSDDSYVPDYPQEPTKRVYKTTGLEDDSSTSIKNLNLMARPPKKRSRKESNDNTSTKKTRNGSQRGIRTHKI